MTSFKGLTPDVYFYADGTDGGTGGRGGIVGLLVGCAGRISGSGAFLNKRAVYFSPGGSSFPRS